MHIKSIVLEGFKSYAQRTEVNNFDPLFNAITGLNGSGKSNILDSICFLLGISNLSQVSQCLEHLLPSTLLSVTNSVCYDELQLQCKTHFEKASLFSQKEKHWKMVQSLII